MSEDNTKTLKQIQDSVLSPYKKTSLYTTVWYKEKLRVRRERNED
jgi:hypothetical protein